MQPNLLNEYFERDADGHSSAFLDKNVSEPNDGSVPTAAIQQ
ncbi:hypothetical protein [Pseudoalteromonas sp. SG43-6]|nr:hypothetical protein [Pseudoalteromonas sp. SG43-6]